MRYLKSDQVSKGEILKWKDEGVIDIDLITDVQSTPSYSTRT